MRNGLIPCCITLTRPCGSALESANAPTSGGATLPGGTDRRGGQGERRAPPGLTTSSWTTSTGYSTLVDIPGEIQANEPWFNQTLTTVNDSVVRLGIIEGEFHWHRHDDQDESSWCWRAAS